MIERLFHAWEHRLASVTKDRVVRPFDWGADWLSPGGSDIAAATASDVDIERWVEEVMRDTDAFFAIPATCEYRFEPAAAEVAAGGEAGTLRFPSALVTPHATNNTVVARWFPSPGEPAVIESGERSIVEAGTPAVTANRTTARTASLSTSLTTASGEPPVRTHGRGRAVVVLPQWNSDAEGHIGLAKLLARFGVSALRLSLPYHDTRMPPELTRADYIVSSNVVRTLQACRQAVLDARRAVAWLKAQGFERIGIVGTSLGSCLAMLTSAHEPLIRAQALNHVSPYFADVVWRGLSTRHVRAGMDGHVDLERLRRLWRPISPFSYLERVRDTQTLLVYARYDLTFPVDLSRMLVDEFRRRQLPHQVAVLPCGHYSTGMAPFKFLDAYILTRFLRRAL